MADEYIRKQNAIDEINANADDLKQNGGIPYAQGARAMAIVVEQIPPADVAPVVRCKDCENWQTDWNPSIPDRHYCAVMDSMMKADDFCSYGERGEEIT